MILHALPVLEADAKLREMFKPSMQEDQIWNAAMLVYDDEEIAKKYVRAHVNAKIPAPSKAR